MNIVAIMTHLAEKRPIFHNEADFQHALAWEIRERYPESTIRLEKRVQGSDAKLYLDIWVQYEGKKYAIELKYKTKGIECRIDNEDFSLSNHGAQDIGRYDVLKDLQRLEYMTSTGVADEGYLIFLTNDPFYYTDPGQDKPTADRDFRLHEGRELSGRMAWGEQTGFGTMKGREEPISLNGHYHLRWLPYSRLDIPGRGDFRFLFLEAARAADIRDDRPEEWFRGFTAKGEIPESQVDLRDKLAAHLQAIGYEVSINRAVNQQKVDIWAERGSERIIIEVRYKTALLQTIHNNQHVHLKKQLAYDISRYDFISDLGKVESIVRSHPGLKGYALLITNDRKYWLPPMHSGTVDEEFLVHEGRLVAGQCAWKEEASEGTTHGREDAVRLQGEYPLHWQPYLTLGPDKNQQFQSLLVEVSS